VRWHQAHGFLQRIFTPGTLNLYCSVHTVHVPIDKRTISVPREQSSYIDGFVGSGKYSSPSEVVRAG
jgi:hypothetical protein